MNKKYIVFLLTLLMVAGIVYSQNTPAPVGPLPNDRQVEWYHREMQGFIHFGINTFYNQEWGNGSEDPARFNPSSLDAAQWVKTFKDAGFTTIILVAKHHDGFCYWPSAYTTHDVASSPWKSGNGDEVKEVADACKAAGIKLGIYLSPWDRHEKTYGTNAYNDYFNNQLTELLSNYGTIWEVWFDGAGEAAGTYDWTRWEKTIHTLQPNCIIWGTKTAYNYAEVRWVGNEGGVAGDPCWSTINPSEVQNETSLLNSGQVNGSAFIPAETNTSIRPGWFYHSSEDGSVKSVDTLWNYYFTSVGRNTVMLLNIPPDTRGLMNSTDVNNVLGMYQRIYNTFSNNLAAGSTAAATDTRGTEYSPQNLIDNDEATYYASSDGVTNPTITFTLNGNKTFDCVMVQEVIKLGERVTGWAVDAYYNNTWNTLCTKQCIGYKWIERFNSVTASSVRLRITGAKACPAIHTFGVYLRSSGGAIPTPTPVVAIRSAFSQVEAESFNSSYGTVKAETCGEGSQDLGYISNGDWVCYNNIDFGTGADSFQARVASTVTTGKIYVRVDTPTGTQIATLTGPNTGNSQTYTTVTIPVTNTNGNIIGVHDLYLYFDAWVNLNWFLFSASTETPGPTAGPTAVPTTGPTPVPGTISIACGSSSEVGSFQPDQYYSGGSTFNNTNTVDVSAITSNPPPAALFNNERYGAMSYTIPGFTAGNSYAVTLYFAETYLTSSGSRLFNVFVNGAAVLSNFDIYVSAGGQNKAIAQSFTTIADGSGQIVIQLTAVTENPKINGIAINPGSNGGTLGDVNVNGTIDIVDALLVAQYYVGLAPAGFVVANADVNCSGTIDIVDALLVAQYYVGLISDFPC